MNRTLDAALSAFATRRLEVPYPYLILDARYDRAREGGVIASRGGADRESRLMATVTGRC
jgi:transposase-like protein